MTVTNAQHSILGSTAHNSIAGTDPFFVTNLESTLASHGAREQKGTMDLREFEYLLTNGDITNIWEQPLAGGPPKQITKFTSGRIFDFNWTADGKQLLLSRGEVTSDVVLLSNVH